ncbi:MAG: SRPBCC family protein [Planctomycetota bacterium]
MKLYTLERNVVIARPLDEVHEFFAAPQNLELLTPPWLRFQILTPPPIEMRRGAIFDYKISLHGFPLRWRSLISAWEPKQRFVDEQLRGPYSVWIHEHLFESVPGGTRVTDRVRYAAPGGPLVHRMLVRPDLERIFRYRCERVEEIFSPSPEDVGGEGAERLAQPA